MTVVHKPLYRRASTEVEKAVEFAHQLLSQHPRYAWAYEGGRSGRARIRGTMLSEVSDRTDHPDVFDWKFYYRIWVCQVCKEMGHSDYLADFLDLQGNPKHYVK